MNYQEFFATLQSKYHLEELLLYLGEHQEDFDDFFNLIFTCDEKIAWRILWAVEKVSQRQPEWFNKDKIDRITQLVLTTKHQGLHRIGISVLNSFPVQQPLNVELLNSLYEWMLIPKYSIGVQSLSMKLLYKYALTDEDLLREFIFTLEQADETEFTAAFVSSKRNIIKRHNHL